MLNLNTIYCGDCLELMKQLENDSINIVITSPPYNAGKNVRGNFYDEYSDNLSIEDYEKFISDTNRECIRVSKYVFFNFQILTNNKLAYLSIFNTFKNNIKDIVIWNKSQVQPSIQPTMLNSKFEFVVVFAKEELCKSRVFERAFFNNRLPGLELNNNVIETNNAANESFEWSDENKAKFSKEFVEWFIKRFTDKWDIILDPFMGTGTTAVVCKQQHRNFIGIELSQDYIDTANNRLNKTTVSLF